jgi:hypothetical protein
MVQFLNEGIINLEISINIMKKYSSVFFFLAISVAVIIQSCVKGTDFEEGEQNQINDFLVANKITVQPKESGLYYIENKAGTGDSPVTGDSVVINYVGRRLDGIVFHTNIEEIAKQYGIWEMYMEFKPYGFIVGDSALIIGLSEGVTYMKEGGSSLVVLPSKLAFNDYIPVTYDIDLLKVIKK